MKTIAAFDFDGTITYRDTLFPFLINTLGSIGFLKLLMYSTPFLINFLFGKISNSEAKRKLISLSLEFKKADDLKSNVKEWSESIKFRPEALERINWHKSQGHTCILVSASFDIYIEYFSNKLEFDNYFCTELEIDNNGYLTGKFSTPNCWGYQKVLRIKEKFGEAENFYLYAYGDSSGDVPLLKFAQVSFMKWKPFKKI